MNNIIQLFNETNTELNNVDVLLIQKTLNDCDATKKLKNICSSKIILSDEDTDLNDNVSNTDNRNTRQKIRDFSEDNPKTGILLRFVSNFMLDIIENGINGANPDKVFGSLLKDIKKYVLNKDEIINKNFAKLVQALNKSDTKFITNYNLIIKYLSNGGQQDNIKGLAKVLSSIKSSINNNTTIDDTNLKIIKSILNLCFIFIGPKSKYKELTSSTLAELSNSTNEGKFLMNFTDNASEILETKYNGNISNDKNILNDYIKEVFSPYLENGEYTKGIVTSLNRFIYILFAGLSYNGNKSDDKNIKTVEITLDYTSNNKNNKKIKKTLQSISNLNLQFIKYNNRKKLLTIKLEETLFNIYFNNTSCEDKIRYNDIEEIDKLFNIILDNDSDTEKMEEELNKYVKDNIGKTLGASS